MGVSLAFLVLVGILGGAVGSFLNVVIYRVPHNLSVVRPASRCPTCATQIKARHNIPIFGWLMVGGKCASCKTPISPRYMLVELAMVALALGVFIRITGGPLTPEMLMERDVAMDIVAPFFLYLVFIGGLVAAAFIDLDWFILPNEITLPGLVLGLATSFAVGSHIGVTWQDALIGAAAGAVVVLVIIYGYAALTGREGMGGGDFKLLAVIGAYLGWQALPLVLLLSSVQALLFAALFRRSFLVEELPPDPMEDQLEALPESTPTPSEGDKGVMQLALPYGPFLALAAIELFLFRTELMSLAGLIPA